MAATGANAADMAVGLVGRLMIAAIELASEEGGSVEPFPGPPERPAPEPRPYPGLAAFTQSDAANFFGRKLVSLSESIVSRIPLVRSIYSGAKQVAETVLSDGDTSFKRVFLVQYPRKGVWSLCFQTSTELAEIQHRTDTEAVVF